MLGPPVDLAQTALAVGVVSAACVGLLLSVPTGAPPDAAAVAASITAVSTAAPPASRTVAVDADAITVAPHRITLHRGARRASATVTGPLAIATAPPQRGATCSAGALRWVTAPVTLPTDGQLRITHRRCGTTTVVLIDV
jgi:hypothetical protein